MVIALGSVVPLIQDSLRRVSLAEEVRGPAAMASLRLSVASVSSANALRGYIITHDPAMRALWSRQWDRVDVLTAEMNGLAPKFTSAENRAAWTELSEVLPQLKAAQASTFQVADSGDAAASAAALKTQVLPLFNRTQTLLVGEKGDGGLAGRQSALLSGDLAATLDHMQRTELQILLSLAGLMVVASVVGWLTTRAIARPLTQLNGALLEMAGGRFEVRVAGTDRADEIGDI